MKITTALLGAISMIGLNACADEPTLRDNPPSLDETRALAITTDGRLLAIDPLGTEHETLPLMGEFSDILAAPVTAGKRMALALSERDGDESRARLIILDENLEVVSEHQPPLEANACLHSMPGVHPLDDQGERFVALCGQSSAERTHAVIFGAELVVVELPAGAYVGRPIAAAPTLLPLITIEYPILRLSVIDTRTGEVTETGAAELGVLQLLRELPQSEDGLVYLADKVRVNGIFVWRLYVLDALGGHVAQTFEGSGELIHSVDWHREPELRDGRVILTTAGGLVAVDVETGDAISVEDNDWPILRGVSPDGRYALRVFADRLVRDDLETSAQLTLDSSPNAPWYQPPGDCVIAVDTLRFSPAGDTVLLSNHSDSVYQACPGAEGYIPLGGAPAMLVGFDELQPIAAFDHVGKHAPRYAPDGSALVYISKEAEDCGHVNLHFLTDEAPVQTSVANECFLDARIEWLRLPVQAPE